ncbi:MAG: hypothetical protein HY897_05520 [Deltaproteobacteria bacterium]|nr:hypothetical protein [Deltaproteobacteria bacterium]
MIHQGPDPILLACAAAVAAGCISAEEAFTGDRVQNLCAESLSACGQAAGCALDNAHYAEGRFPGAFRVLVHSETPGARLLVRLFLFEMKYPGTELLVQEYEPGCADFDREHLKDIDIFELAGDEGTLEFELSLSAKGDHLLDLFSDMSAEFLVTTEVEENF